jgi:hypothetical protein
MSLSPAVLETLTHALRSAEQQAALCRENQADWQRQADDYQRRAEEAEARAHELRVAIAADGRPDVLVQNVVIDSTAPSAVPVLAEAAPEAGEGQ